MLTRKPFLLLLCVSLLAACSSDDEESKPGSGQPAQAVAKRILDQEDLIGGPMSRGRVGDYLLANDRVRVVIGDVGRDPIGFVSPYGGNIIDADLVREGGEPDNDQFMVMSPLINVESTMNATSIQVINDGSNGEPALIRTQGVDDSLDFINASQMIKVMSGGLPLSVPASADDVDIPVELVNEYSLGVGDNHVTIETFIKNVGQTTLGIYIGDYLVNSGGETDQFVPGVGFGEPMVRLRLPFLGMRGEKSARGLAYGYIPEITRFSTAFTETGVAVTTLGINVVGVLLLGLPPNVQIEPGKDFSYVRHFVVAEDLASVQDVRYGILGLDTGTLEGTVTVDGTPLADATVSVVRTPGELGAPYDVISAFQTDGAGRFQGTLPPGRYQLMAAKEGYPYDSGSSTPARVAVDITSGQVTRAELQLPPTGRVRVISGDESGNPVPSKATVVGFDPSPPLENTQSLLGLLDFRGYLFDDPAAENLFGLARTIFLGPEGDSGEVVLEPGSYHLFVSRGPEYSLYESPLTVTAGELTTEEARIAPVIDTTGFVSGDFHVHMINSPDSRVPLDERVVAFLAEGVDYFVASDHAYLTDLGPTIRDLGAEALISTSIGQEITPQDYGHYNAWPLTRDPSRRSMGAIDWGREAPPGEDYRTLGAYCLSPGEIYQTVREDPGEEVIQINHFNSGGGAGLNLLGIDTGRVPPQSTVDPGPFRLDPSLENLFSPNFDVLELLIGNDRGQMETFFRENLGDWFNLLNQGLIYAGSSDSDTHNWNYAQAGTYRNFIASSTDEAGQIDEDEITSHIKQGRMVGGYSPFLTATLHVESTGETGGQALGLPTLVRTTDGRATFRLYMQSPVWVEFDTVELYINTIPTPFDHDDDPSTPPEYQAAPTLVLREGLDFELDLVVDFPSIPGASHYEATVEVPLEGLSEDTWVVALVRGTDGVSEPMFPVVPNELSRETNLSLPDLLDGNLGEAGMLALSFTNPLFIDVNGNGVYDAPMAP